MKSPRTAHLWDFSVEVSYYLESPLLFANKPTAYKRRKKTSLVVQWLRLHAANAGSMGLIPSQGTKIPHAMWCGQKIFQKGKAAEVSLSLGEVRTAEGLRVPYQLEFPTLEGKQWPARRHGESKDGTGCQDLCEALPASMSSHPPCRGHGHQGTT